MGHAGHSNADDFAANLVQSPNSCDRSVDVEGVFINHRLYDDWVASADRDAANFDGTGFAAFDAGVEDWLRVWGFSWIGQSLHS